MSRQGQTGKAWRQAEQLFLEALELPPEGRGAFLAEHCPSEAVEREVRELLEARQRAGTFLERPLSWTSAAGGTPSAAPLAGDRLGSYEIVGQLGEGGMSRVYEAQRIDAPFERRVALKLLHGGLVGPVARQRFRSECQILASLEHPGIARLYDAGVTEDGTAFVVLEKVEGVPLDRFCAERGLGIGRRLALFERVLTAVRFAHRNLVVHCDLKPANILVTPDGEPRLLDFGIARVLGARGEAPDDPTERAMTPAYASPEQIAGERITAASDVFSLGLILRELVTGRRGTTSAWEQAALASEPSRGQAAGGPMDGDLDAICRKALAHEPEARYGSVAELGADLERYRGWLPVEARGGGAAYRLRKLTRRHGLALGIAAALFLLVGTAAVFAGLQARHAARERDRAEGTSEFLIEMFEVTPAEEAAAASVTARELLDRASARIASELGDRPGAQAQVLETIGRVYHNLNQLPEAQEQLERSLEIRRRLHGEDHPDVTDARFYLAVLLGGQGDLAGAAVELEKVLHERRRRHGERSQRAAEAEVDLAVVRFNLGDAREATDLLRRAISTLERLREPARRRHAEALNLLGGFLVDRGEWQEGEGALEAALASRRAQFGNHHLDIAESLETLGHSRYNRGEFGAAVEVYREALDIRLSLLGNHHRWVMAARNSLARALQEVGDLAGAEEQFQAALAIEEETRGETHPDFAVLLNNLAILRGRMWDLKEAESLLRRSLALRVTLLGAEHPSVGQSWFTLATTLHQQGRLGEAEELFARAESLLSVTLPDGHPARGYPKVGRGTVLVDAGRAAEAEELLRLGLEQITASHPADHWRVAWARAALGSCLHDLGRFAEAQPLLQEGAQGLRAAHGDDHFDLQRARARLERGR